MNDDLFNFVDGNLPATNVSENDKVFNIELSVPGFKKEDIKIEIEKSVLRACC
jgi:HSP20 family protein